MEQLAECAMGEHSAICSTGPEPRSIADDGWNSYDTVFLNAKAGMDGIDKKRIQKVVYDMSKGSRYFNNEQRKEADIVQRIQRMNARAASLTPAHLSQHEKVTDLKIAELEASRDLSRTWVHVDMDAFYAAVETLANPSLAGKPMAVGGMSMICTANYEARKFGVRAAMPGFIARKLCPDLIFVRPDFKKYSHYSELSRQVFKEYDPNFVARSMDEAFLDITSSCQARNMSAAEVVEELRSKVCAVTGLTCSAGVGPNRLVAKVCSDINKPNGQFVLKNERGAVMAFVSSLPIRKVCGIGKVTERLLKDVLGISTCSDLLSKRSLISALFSQISTDFFLAVGLGIGGSETPEKERRKSLSNERTFAAISDEGQLFKKLNELVELLANDLQKEDLQGRTLTLKLKESGFEVRSRAVTLSSCIHRKADIWSHASKLLKAELPLSLRLMGLRMSNFKDEKYECSDRSQRTLTGFIMQSGSSGNVGCNGQRGTEAAGTAIGVEQDETDWVEERTPGGSLIDESRQLPSSFDGDGEDFRRIVCPDLWEEKCMYVQERQETEVNLSYSLSTSLETVNFAPQSSDKKIFVAGGKSANCGEANEAILWCRAEPSWKTLQLRYDSTDDQIWVDGNRCVVCGIKVNDCLPCARQEHEDYHLAVFLQQQTDNESVQTSRSPSTKGVRLVERESTKRKTSGGKNAYHTPPKKSFHLPLEAFFSKEKSCK